MAVVVIRTSLAIILVVLFVSAPTITAQEAQAPLLPVDPYGECNVGNGGDVGTAVQMKQILIQDLIRVAPGKPRMNYCNGLTMNGLQMYGYAECTIHNAPGDLPACNQCSSEVGGYLIQNCDTTGAGHAWDTAESGCYFKVGFSVDDVCPAGSN
ncbi:unnamed protein product [Linum tenue]|uniref:Gnk2-homologous domain-containing protein n=1 Tax=Linum tenue TaxID=586396 RepID=A0AAV0N1V6_9ROSI|nr:unnamed protein product [Linum tenue]